MREYAVTYTTQDGERKMETMSGNGHRDIERKIAALGGTILSLERADDEDYSRKSRNSIRRTVGCATIVILAVAGAVVLFWLRQH